MEHVAVRDDQAVGGELAYSVGQLVQWDVAHSLDVSCCELARIAHVDHYWRRGAAQPLADSLRTDQLWPAQCRDESLKCGVSLQRCEVGVVFGVQREVRLCGEGGSQPR